MTRLIDVVSTPNVVALIADGYIRERVHPTRASLSILNYTEKAQYEHVWNHETQACRGLIVDHGEVVARPWSKFFNYGEHAEGTLDLGARVEITDKLDGSLGILYQGPDGWAIATRGSFASDQALHATEILHERHAPGVEWMPERGWTYLFEIIYPANRIVVNYGSFDDISLLGAVRIEDGLTRGPLDAPEWPGRRTETFPYATLADALTLTPRTNAEGVVVRFVDTGFMVKVKQDDYVRLHRLVTGLSERSVWEHLVEHGGAYTDLLTAIPDEFHGWVRARAEFLVDAHAATLARARKGHELILAGLPDEFERKDYAAVAAVRDERALLFNLLDGRDPSPAIWRSLKPFGSNPMMHTSEDVA
jgi:RNA ligase